MLPLQDIGHVDTTECLEMLKLYMRIKDPDVRQGVLALLEDLANETGQLVVIEDEITLS